MTISYSATDDLHGVRVIDHIEQRQFSVRTSDPVDPRKADTDLFTFPVSHACQFETEFLYFNRLDSITIRDGSGEFIESINSHQNREFECGTYSIDIYGPMKIYCRVTDSIEIETGTDYLYLKFGDTSEITLGLRSFHKEPAGTITVPDDPYDLMKAVSTLSSALKSTSCERSFPTLRGHPPVFERGETLAIPDEIEPPETGVKIVVPPEYRHIYAVASLSYYLGATVVPGDVPRIETVNGFERNLASEQWFEDEVARVLRHVFFLDCVVRTEGLYEVDLQERRMVEPFLPFDLGELYHQPLHVQLEEYLQVPHEVVAEHIPDWCLTAHVPSSPEGIEPIPFIVNDLGIIREPRGTRVSASRQRATNYSRSAQEEPLLRSVRASEGQTSESRALVEPETTNESIEHAWFGKHIPRGATKATPTAFENRLSQDEQTGQIDITVVCNDDRMLEEHTSLDNVYGNRGDLPYNIEYRTDLSTSDLAELLRDRSRDFLHYIGHATPEGLRCSDGELDVRQLDSVSIDVFLLNACRSYEQAMALAERGAIAGVGTLGDIVNEQAIEIGRAMAHLLNLGFPLRGAVELIREHTLIGDQYLIVGDGSTGITQPEGGPPTLCDVSKDGPDQYTVTIEMWPSREFAIGATAVPTIDSVDDLGLVPGTIQTVQLTEKELQTYLSRHMSPIRIDGEIRWNDMPGPVNLNADQ